MTKLAAPTTHRPHPTTPQATPKPAASPGASGDRFEADPSPPPAWEPPVPPPAWVIAARAREARPGHTPIVPSTSAPLAGLLAPLGGAVLGIWAGLHVAGGMAGATQTLAACAGALVGLMLGGVLLLLLISPWLGGGQGLARRYVFREHLDLHYEAQRTKVREALVEGAVLGGIAGVAVGAGCATVASFFAGPMMGVLAFFAGWGATVAIFALFDAWLAYCSAYHGS